MIAASINASMVAGFERSGPDGADVLLTIANRKDQ